MTLQDVLAARTTEAAPELVEALDSSSRAPDSPSAGKQRLRCHACGHQCPIPDGASGVCKVRFNDGGRLHVPWGYVGGVQCDPVEKKPFFHAYPGALAYSFGMLGCDLHCSYCQNWVTSQALRDPRRGRAAARHDARPRSSRTRCARARRSSSRPTTSRSSPPNGPSRSSRRRAQHGLVTGFVSNGNGTDARARVPAAAHRSLQGRSQELRRQALSRARRPAAADPRHDRVAARAGVWVEIVTLLDARLQRQRRRNCAA